jgi:hypothetical protein
VSDKDWVLHAARVRLDGPGDIALFGLDKLERAKEWAAG